MHLFPRTHQQVQTRGIYKAVQHRVMSLLSVDEKQRLFFTLLSFLSGTALPARDYTVLSTNVEQDGSLTIKCVKR